MSVSTQSSGRSRAYWLGWPFSALAAAFLLTDATMKLLALPVVLNASAELGFAGAGIARGLGIVLLLCTALYVVPRTAALGAILLTGYLGGAIATHVRVDSPLLTHVLFGAYLAVFLWGGLYLREPKLRALIPLNRWHEAHCRC